jgi:HNH endonuclease
MQKSQSQSVYASYEAGKPRQYDRCPDCGGTNTATAARCRSCRARLTATRCKDCGVRIRKASFRCQACYERLIATTRPVCVDCGGRVKLRSAHSGSKRCRDCHFKFRWQSHSPTCSAEGCDRPHHAKGFCNNHYLIERARVRNAGKTRATYGTGKRILLMRMVDQLPCQLCGYSKRPSHRHRLHPGKDGGKYEVGNVVALCANCHAEVHDGQTAPPAALTAEQILAGAL